ncbi:DNA-binding transcriptional LysR family regulator [Paucibacter oligotrophus]|uniref:DNA-binding transcriptional LysR family regulator n=1 Tax=Roseateles oligotrophus TaxID=1769250 RepID=A0A840LK20_9BURK|nr:LysR substrate-binding domain-containing protein [Roseateles oligotrophus]MBB4845637.1 DNA-binding transcriptional LysR family regulator [Roseateles oligotrophus]
MQDLNDLMYFAHVVDHAGFAPAARALGLPKSKLSRRIALLEERLGVRLIQRSTRRFSVTEVGTRYYRHCKAMLVEAQAAQEAVEQVAGEMRGLVRMSCPIALLHARVAAMVVEFMALNPKVEVQLRGINQPVDLVAEGYDIAIRARTPPLEDSSLVMRELAQRDWILVASPDFCQQHPLPLLPANLSGLPSLGDKLSEREHVWHLVGPGATTASIAHTPRLLTDDLYSLRAAAVAGLGVVQLPAMILSEELRRGQLLQLLPDWCSKGAVVHAVFPSRRGLLPAVRGLIDFLALKFQELDEA